jgi:hypothetical protein
MSYIADTELATRTIFLDSVNATSIMSMNESTGLCQSSYQWYLSSVITCPMSYKMLISLVDAQFSNIFPQVITGFNDVFAYYTNGLGIQQITLPSQHYTVETLASYLSANTIFSVSIDYVNFKLQFSTTGANFIILASSTCGNLIGLTRDQFGNFVNAASFANTLTMPSWFNLSGTPYVFLNVRNLTLGNLDSGINNGAFARLDINAPFGYQCFYRPVSIEQYMLDIKKLNSFRIDLTDHYNNPLCLKGLNIQLTFRIAFIKDISPSIVDMTIDKTLYKNFKLYGLPLSLYNTGEEKNELFGSDE